MNVAKGIQSMMQSSNFNNNQDNKTYILRKDGDKLCFYKKEIKRVIEGT